MPQALQEQEKATGQEGAGRERIVGLTVRLPAATHEALRKVAYERRVSIHSLLLDGVAEVLRREGR